jgi:hypothetical protein
MSTPEPNHGFIDSRRLMGANRYFAEPAVTLTPRGRAADGPGALEAWALRVRDTAAALGWPDPMPIGHGALRVGVGEGRGGGGRDLVRARP